MDISPEISKTFERNPEEWIKIQKEQTFDEIPEAIKYFAEQKYVKEIGLSKLKIALLNVKTAVARRRADMMRLVGQEKMPGRKSAAFTKVTEKKAEIEVRLLEDSTYQSNVHKELELEYQVDVIQAQVNWLITQIRLHETFLDYECNRS